MHCYLIYNFILCLFWTSLLCFLFRFFSNLERPLVPATIVSTIPGLIRWTGLLCFLAPDFFKLESPQIHRRGIGTATFLFIFFL
jgi:hypothetical protein